MSKSKTQKQRKEIIESRNIIIDATNQFSDFCNMRLRSLEYRGIVQGMDSVFLSAFTSEFVSELEKKDYPNLDFIRTDFGYEVKACLVKVIKKNRRK